VAGTPLWLIIAMASDNVANVNFGFKQFVRAGGIYAATKSFMAMDNISIMYRNSALCRFLT